MISSPLRYPGGKAKLFPFFIELIRENKLFSRDYCEPYAGGAGLALRLLTTGYVDRISINDIDPSIYAFWRSALFDTEKFCRLIAKTPISIDQWYRQQEVWQNGDLDNKLALGFSAYFLNRTNRSGIIEGAGPIGGFAQKGKWKLDVRLVKDWQIQNLRALARYSNQIEVTNLDAMDFLQKALSNPNALTYLDPPYYVKGHKLYKNFYQPKDHEEIAEMLLKKRRVNWVVSYDDVPQIRSAYSAFDSITYLLNYSAGEKSEGPEVIFLSDSLIPPTVTGFDVNHARRPVAKKRVAVTKKTTASNTRKGASRLPIRRSRS
ncbi:DNA adenine methylase [Bradyrhizobium sp. Ec3.3]|uniref:DNA adenine methylase n=1 Tax=Bradyrhizobium sp. Ec3.3 TaxID=189753 RepID=UPI000685DC47|nr:DNA adenine methylase [Bradyrhizobium sp. Ec3.3]